MNNKRKLINRKRIINKLWNFVFICLLITLSTIALQQLFPKLLSDIENSWAETAYNILSDIYICTAIIFLVSLVLLCACEITYFFQQSLSHVARYHNAECFNKIEFLLRNRGESNGYYSSIIKEISRVYNEDKELAQLINDENRELLYERKTLLENRIDLFNNVIQVITAFGASIIVSFCTTLKDKFPEFTEISSIVIACGVILFVLLKYVGAGHGGSYLYHIYEYELELLKEKIKELNKNQQASLAEEKIIRTRQLLINTISDLYSNRKNRKAKHLTKKALDNYAKELYELPLTSGLDNPDILWAYFFLNNEMRPLIIFC